MKRHLFFSLILLPLVISAAYAAVPISDKQNPHNLSSQATHSGPKALSPAMGGTDEICIFCHTPHSAAADTPLWSRPDPDMMGGFPLYAGGLGIKGDTIMTGYDDTSIAYPSGASRMCLSCHDGVTSIGILLSGAQILMDGAISPASAAAINLEASHPISFNYNNTVITSLLSALDYKMPDAAVDSPLDKSGQMQCTTCHDPHGDTRGLLSYDNLPFWRHQGAAASYSDVCNNCHITPPSGIPGIHTIP